MSVRFASKKCYVQTRQPNVLRERDREHEYPEVTTNVVAIKLNDIDTEAKLMTGEPAFCTTCSAAFSSIRYAPLTSKDQMNRIILHQTLISWKLGVSSDSHQSIIFPSSLLA